jgi:hypothetical protein
LSSELTITGRETQTGNSVDARGACNAYPLSIKF